MINPGILVSLWLTLMGVMGPQAVGAGLFEGTNLAADELPYPQPPYRYEGSRFLMVTLASSPEVLEALVPEPLRPIGDGLIHLIVAQQRVVEPVAASYNEAMLSVPVSLGKEAGGYMPVLYLDNPGAIVAGREFYGFSKVDGEIQWMEDGDVFRVTVDRWGARLVDLEVQLGPPLEQIPELAVGPNYNLKLIPAVEVDRPPVIKQLTSTTLGDRTVTTMRLGEAQLKLGSSPSDPLASIPVHSIVFAAYSEQSFVLDYGEVVHDYLNGDGNRHGQ